MKYILSSIALAVLFVSPAWANKNNEVMKECVQAYAPNYNKASACYFNWKTGDNAEKLAELRDFLKHNPRYRVPGQSMNKCWGKPREMPFESAYIKQTQGGFEAGVSYKDKIPAVCYENGPWDNRDVKN